MRAMAFFIVDLPAHVTWYRYVVEADSEQEAIELAGDEGYDEPDGYWDADWDPGPPAQVEKIEASDREEAIRQTYFEFQT